jgi:hypothetical protein
MYWVRYIYDHHSITKDNYIKTSYNNVKCTKKDMHWGTCLAKAEFIHCTFIHTPNSKQRNVLLLPIYESSHNNNVVLQKTLYMCNKVLLPYLLTTTTSTTNFITTSIHLTIVSAEITDYRSDFFAVICACLWIWKKKPERDTHQQIQEK